jgi:hypothetical protein
MVVMKEQTKVKRKKSQKKELTPIALRTAMLQVMLQALLLIKNLRVHTALTNTKTSRIIQYTRRKWTKS